MDHLLQFVIRHWELVAAFVVVAVLLLQEETKKVVNGVTKVSAHDATRLINHDDAFVLDVRDQAAFENGHVIGSEHCHHSQLLDQVSKFKKYQERPVVLICQHGVQSLKTGAQLKKAGFDQLYALTGGVEGWKREGLPVTKHVKKESGKKAAKAKKTPKKADNTKKAEN